MIPQVVGELVGGVVNTLKPGRDVRVDLKIGMQ